MKSIKIFLWIFPVFFIFNPASSTKAADKDVIKEWIREDMGKETVNRLETLATQREKAKLEAAEFQLIQLYVEASELVELKKYNEAREKYQEILALNPEETNAKEYIAKIDRMQELSREKELKRETTRNVKEKREKFQELASEGADLYRQKKYSQAREKWEEALRYDPDNAGIKEWVRRARIQEVKEAEKETLFEKELEERAALAAVDKAYIPKSRIKEERKKAEEEGIEEEKKKDIEEKLDKIMIGDIHVKNANLRQIVEEIFSRVKDINIFIDWTAISKVTAVSSGAVVTTEESESEEGEVKEASTQAESNEVKTMDLNLDIYNPVSLRYFLDYLMTQTGLKYRVEEQAVIVSTPQALEKEDMVVKVYKLKFGMTKLRPVTLKPLGAKED